jgi:hypothetical protein
MIATSGVIRLNAQAGCYRVGAAPRQYPLKTGVDSGPDKHPNDQWSRFLDCDDPEINEGWL